MRLLVSAKFTLASVRGTPPGPAPAPTPVLNDQELFTSLNIPFLLLCINLSSSSLFRCLSRSHSFRKLVSRADDWRSLATVCFSVPATNLLVCSRALLRAASVATFWRMCANCSTVRLCSSSVVNDDALPCTPSSVKRYADRPGVPSARSLVAWTPASRNLCSACARLCSKPATCIRNASTSAVAVAASCCDCRYGGASRSCTRGEVLMGGPTIMAFCAARLP